MTIEIHLAEEAAAYVLTYGGYPLWKINFS